MRIIKPNRLVLVDRADTKVPITYHPNCRYVVSDWEHEFIAQHTPKTTWAWSSFNSYERRYGGQDLSGKRLAIYRHTAFGDQLMVSALPHALKVLYPESTIHFYCDPALTSLWVDNPHIEGGACPLPMPFDAIRDYDYHLLFEGMLENNGEPDQNNCYDDMFAYAGLRLADTFKHPYFVTRSNDYEDFRLSGLSSVLGEKYLVYHLAPANMNRCYPPEQGMEFLHLFLQEHTDWKACVVGTMKEQGSFIDTYRSRFPPTSRCIDTVNKIPQFRTLAPLLEGASLVVCPDSAVLHLTASFPSVPIIGLWGLFSPMDRAKYYFNHRGIVSNACPHRPCHNHDFELPANLCKDAKGWVKEAKYCRALESITPEDILFLANKTVGG